MTGYTHAGIFHADDVFATALLRMIDPCIEIKRVNKLPDGVDDNAPDTIIYDIGGGKYDHHKNIKYREDGITPYSSFGLLWAQYGAAVSGSEETAKGIENTLVIPIDLQDNGKERNPLSSVITTMNPLWDEDTDLATAFDTAVDFAYQVLDRYITSGKSGDRAKQIVTDLVKACTNGIIVLDRYVPWQRHIPADSNVRVVIFPSLRGGWNLQTISSELYPLPENWTQSLPDGMTFAHPGRFIAACIDRKTAETYAAEAVRSFT